MDVKPGGRWRITLIDERGNEYPSVLVYRDVVEGERLVFGATDGDPGATLTFSGRDGRDRAGVSRPRHPRSRPTSFSASGR
jgi:uncharacterized protein YndB with AHSA1/START domain